MPKKRKPRSPLVSVQGAARRAAIDSGEFHFWRPKARTEDLSPKVANRTACRSAAVRSARNEY
jgi:hypothetical protein